MTDVGGTPTNAMDTVIFLDLMAEELWFEDILSDIEEIH